MPLWPSRPRGYSNLTPASTATDASLKTAHPLATAAEDKKIVSFSEDDSNTLLGGEKRKKGGFAMPLVSMPTKPSMPFMPSRPSMPSMPSSKRMSMSMDVFHRKGNAAAPKVVKAEKMPASRKPNAKATRYAQAVSGLISGQTATAALSVHSDPFADPGSKGDEDARALGEVRVAPQMSAKQLKQLKSSLVNPKEATQIIDELKRMSVKTAPLDEKSTPHTHPSSAPHAPTKGACLECTDAEAISKSSKASAEMLSGKIDALSSVAGEGIPSAGKILGQIATSSGAFNALAGVTGRMVDAAGSHNGVLTPPADRLSVMVYWWGYEIVLPPPTLAYLGSVHSVAGTLFTFLQALAMGGGVPELAPFIRYLSMYIDMEWKAIQGQDRGKGIVLAATWIMPVAVVPRAFDFF